MLLFSRFMHTEGRGKLTQKWYAYSMAVDGIGQFREFESPRVHTRINSWGLFSHAQVDSRKT